MQNFTLENPLFQIFSKIFYNNNQNVTIIYSKKKKIPFGTTVERKGGKKEENISKNSKYEIKI